LLTATRNHIQHEGAGVEFFIFLVIALVGGSVLNAVIKAGVVSPGRALQAKFQGLGAIAGRTEADIVSVVGPPNSITSLPGGKRLLQWQATGYHIALRFNGTTCDGVTHEHAAG
jgi:hypothetical protein